MPKDIDRNPMYVEELLAVICYFAILLTIGFFSYRRHISAADFIIGNRSMNYWLTALGSPCKRYEQLAIHGLSCCGLYWRVVQRLVGHWAVSLHVFELAVDCTEDPCCHWTIQQLDFFLFFWKRLADTSGTIRIFTAVMSLLFYTIYISAGLLAWGCFSKLCLI